MPRWGRGEKDTGKRYGEIDGMGLGERPWDPMALRGGSPETR
jgi:hypothetical protein